MDDRRGDDYHVHFREATISRTMNTTTDLPQPPPQLQRLRSTDRGEDPPDLPHRGDGAVAPPIFSTSFTYSDDFSRSDAHSSSLVGTFFSHATTTGEDGKLSGSSGQGSFSRKKVRGAVRPGLLHLHHGVVRHDSVEGVLGGLAVGPGSWGETARAEELLLLPGGTAAGGGTGIIAAGGRRV